MAERKARDCGGLLLLRSTLSFLLSQASQLTDFFNGPLAMSAEDTVKIALVYSDRFLGHRTTPGHPERPERLTAIIDGLKKSGLYDRLLHLAPEPAPRELVEAVHDPEYVERARITCRSGTPFLDCMDCPVCEESFETALLAAGAGLAAVDAVAAGKAGAAFCAVRPPGHHAERDRAMGFCMFNNLAIAARYARRQHGLERILIVDFDVHHPNSTQATFYEDPGVLLFSIHRYPFYPGTGARGETGAGEGRGTNINVPFAAGRGMTGYRKAFEEELGPAAAAFDPDLVLISAGFDAHQRDPLGGMELTSADYGELTSMVAAIAREHCGGRIVSFLEGGYDLQALSTAVPEHIKALH